MVRSLLGCLAAITFTACASVPRTNEFAGYFTSREAAYPFSGSVQVVKRGQTIFAQSYGFADAEQLAPNRNDTIYRIGSLTKPIVSAAVMNLVATGTLSPSDPVCRWFSPCPAGWEAVTLRHLLSHTSGIPDRFGDVPAGPGPELVKVIDGYLATKPDLRPATPPGEQHRYSNLGYLLVAYVAEKAAGKSWLSLIDEHVNRRASMPDTMYDDVWRITPRRARGYERERGTLKNIAYKDDGAFAAGGLLSTTADLSAFANALFRGSLVPAALKTEMLTPVRADYGYGWQITQHFGRDVYAHRGGTNGFASYIVHFPADDLTVTVLSNVESESARGTACDLASIALGADHARLGARAAAGDPASLTGTYVAADGVKRTLAVVDGALRFQPDGSNLALEPVDGRGIWRFADQPETLLRIEGNRLTGSQCGRELFSATRE